MLARKGLLRALPRASALAPLSRSHCQVPCGIFDDPVRVTQLKEDAGARRCALMRMRPAPR
jgi:hypothetical protein